MKALLLPILILFFILSKSVLSFSQLVTEESFDETYDHAMDAYNENRNDEAVRHFLELLKYLDGKEIMTTEDYSNYAMISNHTANIYLFNSFDLSTKYIEKAIWASKKTKSPGLISESYSLKYTAFSFHDFAEPDTLQNIIDSSLFYAKKSGSSGEQAQAHLIQAMFYSENNYCRYAAAHADSVSQFLPEIGEIGQVSSFYFDLGYVCAACNDLSEAEKYFRKSYELSSEIDDIEGMVDASYNLAEIEYERGNYRAAADYFRVHADSAQAMYYIVMQESFTEANAKYETEKKDKEIARKNEELLEQQLELASSKLEGSRQRRQRDVVIFASVVGLMLATMIYLVYYWRSRKKHLRAEQSLETEKAMNEQRMAFLENVAHEIRTPLTLIKGYVQLASENDASGQQNEYLKAAIESSNVLLNNANDLLELQKLEQNKLVSSEETVEVHSFLRRIFFAFESLSIPKNVELEFNWISGDFDSEYVRCATGSLEKIVSNLVSNAVKYSPEGSKVCCNVAIRNGVLEIAVTDEGPGVSDKDSEKIFDRFYQGEGASSVSGIGVGLSLSKELAESIGGTIVLERNSDVGSRFVLTVPIKLAEKKEEEETELDDAAELKPSFDFANRSVLVVEDNPEMKEYIKKVLQPYFNVYTCRNGLEALQKISEKTFHAIISDVMMPMMDGYELKTQINKIEKYRRLPFIFLTAKPHLEDRLKGFGLGIDDYLLKPFESRELIARLTVLLRNHTERENWILENKDLAEEGNLSADEQLQIKIRDVLAENLSNEHFTVPDLASEVGYSQRQLTRFVKRVSGLSPVKYILEYRLQKAHQLLELKKYNSISEVRAQVGVPSASHFNRKFAERFGKKPSDMLG